MTTSDAPGQQHLEARCQSVNPTEGDTRRKREQVRDMFDHIAPSYDTMNRLMSFGIDRLWRRELVSVLAKARPRTILDIATGTGDLAILLAEKLHPESVTGLDLSEEMVEVGRRKVLAAELSDVITLETGDSLNLPYADESFDAVTVAYGVRNFEDLLRGYREMHRVLRPGGILCVLELSTPTNPLALPLYRVYTGHVIPLMGKLIAHDRGAYDYLPRSIAAVPQGKQMLAIIDAAGFRSSACHPMTMGACTLYVARK
ncbi:MAG: bifunctional demethylmenaquinone methyltransferase/2-methoxy-6-polyprenyl-1,4-benzoquinol methylase UbiE [Candidatus Amulumruptor caecigallinarius]|nr:bifunctional demethylmenaquinone methyltransferase/2-methoxy-6-polyprenyl-1,4-benzoquinol methylase UbiE [Candidatus Amulumruptor caecigallinarius]MCM1397517.1 bifunctional demethylmenaquinone methyltransferase/2-methoxy-6-polyprenyl-1,4-benzoquinol methylase UbiE [Candidatus Amulumruptor caecigallinarius]MCM1454419.1 bifunctional demethylmenaquinone methyltransferase/2-methoxy-6-polyprenyl-1,4-benzoquinol methylase UbiE [bacterium]